MRVQVVRGMEGQMPHLDYPYYRHLALGWGAASLPSSHMFCFQVRYMFSNSSMYYTAFRL